MEPTQEMLRDHGDQPQQPEQQQQPTANRHGQEHNNHHHQQQRGSCQTTTEQYSNLNHEQQATKQKEDHGKRIVFPVILYTMLEDAAVEGFEDVVSWNQNGRCFKVHNREQFLQNILPRYSKLTHFKSYVRQLNLWGFSCIHGGRANADRGSYHHIDFVRGQFNRCKKISRCHIKSRGKPAAAAVSASNGLTKSDDATMMMQLDIMDSSGTPKAAHGGEKAANDSRRNAISQTILCALKAYQQKQLSAATGSTHSGTTSTIPMIIKKWKSAIHIEIGGSGEEGEDGSSLKKVTFPLQSTAIPSTSENVQSHHSLVTYDGVKHAVVAITPFDHSGGGVDDIGKAIADIQVSNKGRAKGATASGSSMSHATNSNDNGEPNLASCGRQEEEESPINVGQELDGFLDDREVQYLQEVLMGVPSTTTSSQQPAATDHFNSFFSTTGMPDHGRSSSQSVTPSLFNRKDPETGAVRSDDAMSFHNAIDDVIKGINSIAPV